MKRKQILEAALALAGKHGYVNVTRAMIAERAGVSAPSINYYFGTMHELRAALLTYATATGSTGVAAQFAANKWER